jgi:asparagine synthase (glutamine-hydrolysing)
MRTILACTAWPELPLPAGAWLGADGVGRPLGLAYGSGPAPVATNPHGTVRAVLAGSICNARQLRAGLDGDGSGGPDGADLVVQLYEKRGIPFVQALRGAFALVVWDARTQRLLFARDHLGLVPLYYATEGGRLAVSSGLPGLAVLPELAASWDAAALDAFLALGCVPPPETFYTAIRQLRPGELGVWEEGRLRLQRYWQLSFPERRLVRSDVPAMLREQVLESLRMRQPSAAGGLLLSGGLGSAALLALPAIECPAGRAYTGGFDDCDDEVRLAAELATRGGVEHVPVTEAPAWPAAIDALLTAHGGPVGGVELAAVQRAAARASGDVDVVLAGLGGDEIFGGSEPALAAERLRRYRELPGLAREGAQLWARLTPSSWSPRLRGLVRTERLAPLEMYARAVSLIGPEERAELYTQDTLAALGDARPWGALATLFAEAVASGAEDTLDAIHHVELTLRLPSRAAAFLAAAPGLEVRLPLADHRLAQFAASVPAGRRASASSRSLLLREALGDRLPSAAVRRPHAASAPTRAAWAELIDGTLSPGRIAAQGFFRHDTVARLCEEHLAGRRDHGPRLWAIAVATRWLDGASLPTLASVRAAG